MIHTFECSEDAYDSSQCDDAIKDGDILVTPESVAVLVQAWPVLVKGEPGEFHTLATSWETLEGGRYLEASIVAQATPFAEGEVRRPFRGEW
jgi:hypothetical protein